MALQDKNVGLKRIRLIASAVGGIMFGFTAAEQFQAEGGEFLIPGVLISVGMGFLFIFILMTIINYLIKLFRKGN